MTRSVASREAFKKLKRYLEMPEEEVVKTILDELYQEGWKEGFDVGKLEDSEKEPFF